MAYIYMIGGANGSRKTTTAFYVLPNYLKVIESVVVSEDGQLKIYTGDEIKNLLEKTE